MWSGVIDFLTETAGLSGSDGAFGLPARHARQRRVHLIDQRRQILRLY